MKITDLVHLANKSGNFDTTTYPWCHSSPTVMF